MRISEEEHNIIKSSVLEYDPNASVYLFGSRVNDRLKGGDIDILCISETIERKQRRQIRLKLLEDLGEQKIDFLVKTPTTVEEDPFISHIMKSAVAL
jgi:predicted nucleotidyltransferase